MRRPLPNRRDHELVDFRFRGLRHTLGIGRFHNGGLAEVFVDCERTGSPMADDARDAAVCLSIALQHDVPVETIRLAVTRNSDNAATGIVGKVLDILSRTEGFSP